MVVHGFLGEIVANRRARHREPAEDLPGRGAGNVGCRRRPAPAARRSPSDGFQRACALTELDEGALAVELEARRSRSCAPAARSSRSATCARTPRSRSARARSRTTIECWLHGSCFDLRTGKPTNPPATQPVPIYRVKIEGDDVYVTSHHSRSTETRWPRSRSATCTSPSDRGRTKEILRGVDLTVSPGETHAIMGPNGSGKSTLAYAIAGHPKYNVTSGEVTLDGDDVLDMTVDERARAGLFLAMQYPVEVPGVSVSNFLRTAKTAHRRRGAQAAQLGQGRHGAMDELQMDPTFAQRNVNEGFSGGEKKRHEILQMEILNPKVAILDETDSGLDIDALKVVSEGVNRFARRATGGVLLITHYTRILRYIKPDRVHMFVAGRIVEQGGAELAERLEAEGYERYNGGRREGLITP